VIKTTKLRVVAVTHGDDSQFFFLLPEKGKKKVEGRRRDSWRRLSIFFLLPEKGKKKVEGCRHDSWRQPKNSCCRITRKN